MKRSPDFVTRRGEGGAGRPRLGVDGGVREEGAILILALAYLVAVSLSVLMLSNWATNDLNNSTKFSSANSLTVAASDMMNASIQYVRYNPLISSSQEIGVPSLPVACWGGEATASIPVIDGDQVAVWCQTTWEPRTFLTRTVTFAACPINISAETCSSSTTPPGGGTPVSNALLSAKVIFDDYPPAPTTLAPIDELCSVWCGTAMTISSWTWGPSAPTGAGSLAASMIFSNEPSTTSAGASTQAAVTVYDLSGSPVVGDTVELLEQSGPANGISASTSTLTAVTNSAGVASFTNIVPEYVGNYILTAIDGVVSANSTNLDVTTQQSVITVSSTAPTNATENGTTYSPVASASSGDAVTITSATTSVCTVSGGVVSFGGLGTCTLDFNDLAVGNPNYAAASQVTQSFVVGGLAGTQVALALSTNTPGASATTNVTITMTLENAVGVPVNSNGTTTVVLSDIGNGFFAAKNGVAGATALDVTFASGASTATAYFGNETVGADTISAENGTTRWGTAALTVQGGTPAQVAIVANGTSPTVSSVTSTTLTLQLEDAFGNPCASTGTTTLTLSDSNGGFFAGSNGAAGTSTLSVNFASGAETATAFYGNTNAGTDTITAKSGTTAWGSTTVTPVAGPATSVQVNVSPSPGTSKTTNTTVTMQLVDQYGNAVAKSGVSLTLSNSGVGFFATGNGATGTATLALMTNASGGAKAFFGDDTTQSVTITVAGVAGSGISVTTPSINV
jgi:hypothetical protein